jgi:hypothetical protein
MGSKIDVLTKPIFFEILTSSSLCGSKRSELVFGSNFDRIISHISELLHTRVCQKVSGLAAWSENRKCYSRMPLGAAVSLFCELV